MVIYHVLTVKPGQNDDACHWATGLSSCLTCASESDSGSPWGDRSLLAGRALLIYCAPQIMSVCWEKFFIQISGML